MNVTTIILGITSIVLAVAFFFSLGGLKKDNSAEEQQEMKELREQVAIIKAEAAALRLTPDPYAYNPAVLPNPAPTVAPPAMPDESATTEVSAKDLSEIERLKEELASTKQSVEKAERKADVANEEALMAFGDKTKADDRLNRNKRSVENALTLGKVIVYNTELGFLTFRPAMDRAFSPGEKLAVRRNSGIMSRATVSGEGNGEVVADIMPNALADGMPDIKPGDDIILLPDYYDPPDDPSEPADVDTNISEENLGNVGNSSTGGVPALPNLDLPDFSESPNVAPDGVEEIPLK